MRLQVPVNRQNSFFLALQVTPCNFLLQGIFLPGTRGPLTLGGPLDSAYPAYPIVTPLYLP